MNNLLRVVFLLGVFVFSSFLVYVVFFLGKNIGSIFIKPQFSDFTGLNKSKDVSSETSLFLGGDVMLGRTVMIKSFEFEDYIYSFRKIADEMRTSDIVFFNLESPVIENCPFHESGYVFCADPLMLEGLTYSGTDVVTLANNHILNYGESGKGETVRHLQNVNILSTGIDELAILERGDLTFGFLGFDKSQQVNPKLNGDEIDLIISSESKVDILVIAMHWGIEYQDEALLGVKNLASELISYGADVIAGHHPHWVQNWEYIEGKPVFYSLGNFVFDQMWSEETKKGLAVKLFFNKEGELIKQELLPTYMNSWAQPEFVGN